MAHTHWRVTGGHERPFVSRELAERFAAYWPGHVQIVPEPERPFTGPIWNVQVRDGGSRLTLMYENRSEDIRF